MRAALEFGPRSRTDLPSSHSSSLRLFLPHSILRGSWLEESEIKQHVDHAPSTVGILVSVCFSLSRLAFVLLTLIRSQALTERTRSQDMGDCWRQGAIGLQKRYHRLSKRNGRHHWNRGKGVQSQRTSSTLYLGDHRRDQ